MLDRKRARDRKAQRAMRERTKEEIFQSRLWLEQTKKAMAEREAYFSWESTRLAEENAKLKEAIQKSKQDRSLEDQRRLTNVKHMPMIGLSLDASLGAAWCPNLKSGLMSSRSRTESHFQHEYRPGRNHEQFPKSSLPSTPSDKILTSFIDVMRSRLRGRLPASSVSLSSSSSSSSSLSPPPSVRYDSLEMTSENIHFTVSKVVVDVLSTYSEIATVRKKAAGLFLMVNVLTVSRIISPHPMC